MKPLIVTAAINGGITSRDKQKFVPYSPNEIANSVYEAWNAGASVAHIHARCSDGKPSYDKKTWGSIITEVRSRCDIILNLSASGFNLPKTEPFEMAWNHLEFKPEIASFNCGSVNHGHKPFINPKKQYTALANDLIKYSVKPEIEVYHSGVIPEAIQLMKDGLLSEPLLFSLAFGIHGGTPANCKNLINLIDNLPEGSLWSALGIGAHQLPINTYSILLGGHVRTGLEDNIYYRKGELATGNAQLVERVVHLSRELGREIASCDEARKIFNLN